MRWMAMLVVALVLTLGAGAEAQQRPLVTEDPETVGAGVVLIEGGLDHLWGQFYPLSGLEGNLLRLPTLGISIGVSSIAEIQIDGGLYQRLAVTDRFDAPLADMLDFEGDTTSSVEDLVVGTKIRIAGETETRPAFGARFATRLPNASNESGLGLDTLDFYSSLLVGKTVQSIRVVGNIGLGILADPTRGDRQNDVLLYGISFARAVAQGLEVVGEINGRANTREGVAPPGTENRAMLRIGSRYTRGPARVDGAVLVGMTGFDPGSGITVGFTYVFHAFRIP
jgi:hypothetical protein